jgi:hypothetical protein
MLSLLDVARLRTRPIREPSGPHSNGSRNIFRRARFPAEDPGTDPTREWFRGTEARISCNRSCALRLGTRSARALSYRNVWEFDGAAPRQVGRACRDGASYRCRSRGLHSRPYTPRKIRFQRCLHHPSASSDWQPTRHRIGFPRCHSALRVSFGWMAPSRVVPRALRLCRSGEAV